VMGLALFNEIRRLVIIGISVSIFGLWLAIACDVMRHSVG